MAPVVAAVAVAATGGLLVWDLKRPERFYLLFTRGNRSSWLVLGGYCLLGFGLAAAAWFVTGLLDAADAQRWLAVPVIATAVLAAGYTAFLFAQAEGRDLWQSRWLFPHLLVQAAMTGAGALAVVAAVAGADADAVALVARTLAVAALATLAISALDLLGHHHSRGAQVAATTIVRGRYARLFWLGSVVPTVLAVVLAAASWTGDLVWPAVLAGLLVQPALLVARDGVRARRPGRSALMRGRLMTRSTLPGARTHERLRNFPPPETWDHHVAHDARAHPRKVPREFMLIPTTCFNCESACGLLAYVDKDDLSVTKLEGNPAHPGSRGRNCAKGPATINQIDDPERILHPLRRVGERGAGGWERVQLGRRPRRHRRHASARRSTTDRRDRGDVPRRPSRRGRLRRAVPAGVGRRRAQQPHQRLLRRRPARLHAPGAATTGPRPTTPTPR